MLLLCFLLPLTSAGRTPRLREPGRRYPNRLDKGRGLRQQKPDGTQMKKPYGMSFLLLFVAQNKTDEEHASTPLSTPGAMVDCPVTRGS